MKKLLLSISGLLAVTLINAQAPSLAWQKQIASVGVITNSGPGTGTGSNCKSVSVDQFGNVYSIGEFGFEADFDPSASTFTMAPIQATQAGDIKDVFISKIDANGNFLWAKQIGASEIDMAKSIIIDGNSDIYISGVIGGTVDFDPGSGVFNLSPPFGTTYSNFILKLNSNGLFLWAKLLTGRDMNALSIDASNNIYSVRNYTISGGSAVSVDKFDASGNTLYSKQITSPSSILTKYDIASDINGNAYIGGSYTGTMDFDPSPLTSYTLQSTSEDACVFKLNSLGDFVWAKSFGGSSIDVVNAITVDNIGNVLTVGDFFGVVDFDPSSASYTLTASSTSTDVYISKLDNNGNFLWANKIGGISWDYSSDITTDAINNIYTTGNFLHLVDFDPSVNTQNLTSNNSGTQPSLFISKLDPLGNYLWAGSVTNTVITKDFSEGNSIYIDNSSSIYVTTGATSGGILGKSGNVIKMTQAISTSVDEKLKPLFSSIIYPNPTSSILNIEFDTLSNNVTIQITNTLGQVVLLETITTLKSSFNLQHFVKGSYFINIYNNKGDKTVQKIIVQ